MYTTIDGNFAFLADIDKELYNKAHDMESMARTDFRASGHLCREIMEQMISFLIQKLGIADKILANGYLNREHVKISKMQLGRKYQMLRSKTMLASIDPSIQNAALPNLGEVNYVLESGEVRNTDGYEFLRMLGNTCSHSSGATADIVLSYPVILKAIQYVYRVASFIYRKGDRDIPFEEAIMPILNYHITKSYVPDDTTRSKCIREFTAELREGDGKKTKYAILRMYDKNALVKQAFMLRNQTSFSEASSVSIDSVPEGMTLLRELTPLNSQTSNFYIIAYIFNKEPYPLAEKLSQIKDLKSKLRICARLARCVDNLHNSEIPICCRLLNYESVYVCEFREWVPYIIKFDYSKIIDKTAPAATVYKNAKSAGQEVKTQRKLAKYIPYEWDQLDQEAKEDAWKKVDIYSLGVLMEDILKGKITDHLVDLESLQDQGVPDEVLEMLDLMISDDPELRPDIDEVEHSFEEEL